METKPQEFTFEKEPGKILNCYYFFSHAGVNEGSGYINLFIQPNDPEKPNVANIKIAVKEDVMENSPVELERIAKSELSSFYIIDKAANT